MPYQTRDVEQVVEEFRADGQPYAVFVDNNLGSRPEYLRRLCRALRPLEKIWSAAVTIDVTDDPSLVREMALAGCTGVFIGFESLQNENLADAHKKTPRTEDYARRGWFGLDFSVYKTTTVSRRVLRRTELLGSIGLAEYAEHLRMDADELSSLYHDLLIGVTRFLRDPEAFEYLEKHVIPEILDRVPESEEIRVWVAGCATGEEAYSLAMILFEQLTARGRQHNVKILSTDVHNASLAKASTGIYGEEQLEHVSDERRERFFRKKTNGFQISQDLRQLIVFAPHDNITKDAPFTKMHLITCRNLLIYLEPPAQKTVLSLFHFGLSTGGFLFFGIK